MSSLIIYLAPLQALKPSLVKVLAQHLAQVFDASCFVVKYPLDLISCFNPARQQFDSTKILTQLKAQLPANQVTLGIFRDDLYTEGSTFIFGEAEIKGQVGIISLARLTTHNHGETLTHIRKVATHEVGHILGLRHCQTKSCVMSFSKDLVAVSQKRDRLCVDCLHSLVVEAYLNHAAT